MSQQTATSPVTTRSQWPFLATLAAALTLGLGAAAVAHAADIFVNPTIQGSADSQDCGTTFKPCKTIQFAIGKAAPGDTIHVEDGPYFEHLLIDKSLTIIGEPAGRVVDGAGGVGSVITVFAAATVVITGLTIQNGAAVGSEFDGGGIVNFGKVTINNCTVSNNSANKTGGGIANFGTVTLNNSTVSNNSANTSGGGIVNFGNGTVTLNNSTVTNNAAGEGGGITNGPDGALVFNSSTVANNTAVQNGGGIENFGTVSGTGGFIEGNLATVNGGGVDNHGTLDLGLSTVEGNSAGGDGGGVHNSGSVNLAAFTVKNNTAGGKGGNIFEKSSQTATLTNVTISGGTAASGGGIGNAGTLNLNNVTITKNTATTGDGGGIFNDTGAVLNVRNMILAGNTDTGGEAPDCAGTLTSQGHNLVGVNTGCTILAATGDLVGTGGSPIDPRLGPLANNGGSALSHALLAGSPAIDAGDPSPPGSGGTACEATDQRGVTRPQGPRCDIGAFEAAPTIPQRIPTLDGISQLALVLLLAGALGILTRSRARPRL